MGVYLHHHREGCRRAERTADWYEYEGCKSVSTPAKTLNKLGEDGATCDSRQVPWLNPYIDENLVGSC